MNNFPKSLKKYAHMIHECEPSVDAKYDGILKSGYTFTDYDSRCGQNGHPCQPSFLCDTVADLKHRLSTVIKCDCKACGDCRGW